ncbi:hypothetical protein ES708_12093 [subsurface metagenome]
MTVSLECYQKGKKVMNLYNYAFEIYGKLAEAPLRRTPVDQLRASIKDASDALEMYHDEKLFDEIAYLDIEARLQYIGGILPATITPEQKAVEIEEKLRLSRSAADQLTDRLEHILFQTVAECECRLPLERRLREQKEPLERGEELLARGREALGKGRKYLGKE